MVFLTRNRRLFLLPDDRVQGFLLIIRQFIFINVRRLKSLIDWMSDEKIA